MTAPYNLTNITGADTIPDLMVGAGMNLTDGWLGTLILAAVFMIFLVSFKGFDGKRAFAASSFISAVCGLFLFWMGMISGGVLTIALVLAGVGAVFMTLE